MPHSASFANSAKTMDALYAGMEISFFSPLENNRTIAFIAPEPQDGNTTSTIAMGYYLSEQTRSRTVLIDGNAINGGLSAVFGIADQPGLSDIGPQRREAVENIIYRPDTPFSVIPFGLSRKTIALNDLRHYLKNLIAHLNPGYDHILFDSCSFAQFTAGIGVLNIFQGVIMTLHCEKTRWEKAQTLKKTITDAKGNPVGVILNKSKKYLPNGWEG